VLFKQEIFLHGNALKEQGEILVLIFLTSQARRLLKQVSLHWYRLENKNLYLKN
jgi:hypothetical protein